MKYDTLIFDLDGTLTDTIDDLTDSVNYALGVMGYPPRATEEVRSFVGNGIKRLIYLSVPCGTAPGLKEECLSVFREYYQAHARIKTRPYNGIDEMLTAVRKAGIKTAVVTNKTEQAAIDIVKHFFGDRIDVVIGQVDGKGRNLL